MNEDPATVAEAPASWPIRRLVLRLNRSSGNRVFETDLRELFGLCRAETNDAEALQEMLLQARLNEPLAGRIKALFKCPEALHQFLNTEPPISWAAAQVLVWQSVAAEVGRILSDPSLAESQKSQGKFRQLCRLAVDWGFDPESYRRLLVSSGLTKSRASEIKSVLECKPVRARLLKETPSITWNDALEQSRGQSQSSDPKAQDALKLLAQQLIRRVVRRMENHGLKTFFRGSIQISRTGPGGFNVEVPGLGTLHLEPKPPSRHLPAAPQSL